MTIMGTFVHGWHNHALSNVDINGNVYHRQNEMVMRRISRVRINVMSTDFKLRVSHNRPKYDIIKIKWYRETETYERETETYMLTMGDNTMSMGRYVFFGFFFIFGCLAMAMMGGGMMENPTPPATVNLTAADENAIASRVEFKLDGSPSGNVALFIDQTIIARLNSGDNVTLELNGNERCGVSLKTQNVDGEWEHVYGFACIDYGASIRMTMDGDTVNVGYSVQ